MRAEVLILTCIGFLSFFVLLFGTLALMRWFRHKETMAMIERGLVPNDFVRKRNGKGMLVWGIVITMLGLALMGSLWALTLVAHRSGDSISLRAPLLLPGLAVVFVGIAVTIVYFVTRPGPTAAPLDEALPPAEPGETRALELEADEESSK